MAHSRVENLSVGGLFSEPNIKINSLKSYQ